MAFTFKTKKQATPLQTAVSSFAQGFAAGGVKAMQDQLVLRKENAKAFNNIKNTSSHMAAIARSKGDDDLWKKLTIIGLNIDTNVYPTPNDAVMAINNSGAFLIDAYSPYAKAIGLPLPAKETPIRQDTVWENGVQVVYDIYLNPDKTERKEKAKTVAQKPTPIRQETVWESGVQVVYDIYLNPDKTERRIPSKTVAQKPVQLFRTVKKFDTDTGERITYTIKVDSSGKDIGLGREKSREEISSIITVTNKQTNKKEKIPFSQYYKNKTKYSIPAGTMEEIITMFMKEDITTTTETLEETSEGDIAAALQFKQEITGVRTPETKPKSQEERFTELINQGKSKMEAFEILRNEGYTVSGVEEKVVEEVAEITELSDKEIQDWTPIKNRAVTLETGKTVTWFGTQTPDEKYIMISSDGEAINITKKEFLKAWKKREERFR